MKKVVYKYNLYPGDIQKVPLPLGAKILCIQTQRNEPKLWALVNPDENRKRDRIIAIWATGEPHLCDYSWELEYINTFQLDGGNLVFHAFEMKGD